MRHNNVSESCSKKYIVIKYLNQVFETWVSWKVKRLRLISNLYFISYNDVLFNDWINFLKQPLIDIRSFWLSCFAWINQNTAIKQKFHDAHSPFLALVSLQI